MSTLVDSVLDRLGGLLLPPRCVLCGRAGQPPYLDLCRACEDDLPAMPPACLYCGLPSARGCGSSLACHECRERPPPYDRCFAAYVYAFPLDHLVHCLKYRRQLAVGRVVGTLLGAALARRGLHLDVDVIVPVPLYRLRHAERGYNQSAEIGGWVARGLGREFRESVVTRIRETAAQVGLGTEDRRVNLAGAFACSPEVRGLRLAVVDDVVTTGSTAREIAGALRAAGAVSVDVWCVARALPAERAPARCSADDRARPFS